MSHIILGHVKQNFHSNTTLYIVNFFSHATISPSIISHY